MYHSSPDKSVKFCMRQPRSPPEISACSLGEAAKTLGKTRSPVGGLVFQDYTHVRNHAS